MRLFDFTLWSSQLPKNNSVSSLRFIKSRNRAPSRGQSRTSLRQQASPETQYTLLEKIGSGSFAVVYKARYDETGQLVAVKQIGMDTDT